MTSFDSPSHSDTPSDNHSSSSHSRRRSYSPLAGSSQSSHRGTRQNSSRGFSPRKPGTSLSRQNQTIGNASGTSQGNSPGTSLSFVPGHSSAHSPRGRTYRPGNARPPARSGVRPSSRTQGLRPGSSESSRLTSGSSHTNASRPRAPRIENGPTSLIRRPASKMRRSPSPRGADKPERRNADEHIPPVAPNAVRIIPLGGVEEVGKNMTMVETTDDIIVVDAGFQFVSDEDAPGVDYVLPNTKYLEDRMSKIRAVVITHGHLDHIGGIPFINHRIGNPPIYASELTSLMILKRQDEFPHLPKLDVRTIEPDQRIKMGKLTVRTFPVTHSIPDSSGVVIETEYGNVILSGDLKLDHDDGDPTDFEKKVFGALGKENNIILIADSTNAEKSGFSIPERVVHKTLEQLVREATGRLIIGTFASQFERMIHIIQTCEALGKKIVLEGRSIKTNLEIAERVGKFKVKKDTIIGAEEIPNYPIDKIVILATGAQGEEFAALMRIATKKHKFIALTDRDTIILSSSVIPGNELSVQKLKDNLYRHGVRIIHYRASDVHSTGHGNTGELVWIRQQINPRFFMPAYGYHSMLRCHAQANIDAGFPKENIIIPDNGTVIDIIEGKTLFIRKERAPSSLMMVDGFSIGDIQEVVIRDRKSLAQDGMFVIITTINLKTGKLRKSPDIISRGFVYLRESQDLLSQARLIVKKTVEDTTENMHPINFEFVKTNVTEAVSRFLFQQTNKHPIVIPVVLGV